MNSGSPALPAERSQHISQEPKKKLHAKFACKNKQRSKTGYFMII